MNACQSDTSCVADVNGRRLYFVESLEVEGVGKSSLFQVEDLPEYLLAIQFNLFQSEARYLWLAQRWEAAIFLDAVLSLSADNFLVASRLMYATTLQVAKEQHQVWVNTLLKNYQTAKASRK
ncbi:MAG: hypothetical protein HC848_11100 [Limnobacter sp.]|nr:hypothetical protein [Limnobacter sp.]